MQSLIVFHRNFSKFFKKCFLYFNLSPSINKDKPFKSLVFDSFYDLRRGAIIYVACVDGEIKRGDKVKSFFNKKVYEVQEVGIARPDFLTTNKLQAGQVGYMVCNIRNIKEALVGDTFYLDKAKIEPFPGFKPPKPMVKFFLSLN